VRDPAEVWPDGRVGERWGPQAAPILRHQDQREALTVPRRLGGLRGARTRPQAAAGTRAPALGPFRQGPRRAWPGLLACSPVPALPRTKNALDQFGGA